MAKRPGHVDVVTEVGFCNFCNRTRNLRREEHHMGGLVRTVLTCESCHRTLSSTMGVAAPEAEPEPAQPEPVATPKPAPAKRAAPAKAPAKAKADAKPKAKAPAKRTAAAKSTSRPAAKPRAATAKKPTTRGK